uniref:DNA repair protein RAD51 homolog 4 isoform X2 n=1 Tax=Myxine glutinosa TaxID=7769 RepID=UPI00358F82BA
MVVLRRGLCPGLDAELVASLKARGVTTVQDLVCANLAQLAIDTDLPYKRIAMVRRVLVAQLGAFLASAEMSYAELLSSTAILPTGCTALDSLLDCGLYTGELTEVIGAPGTGKTQVCACVAISVACILKQRVFYIDTTGSLSPSLLLCLTQAKVAEPHLQASALQRIEIVKAFDAFSVLDVVEKFQKRLSQPLLSREEEVRVLLLDSVFSVFSPLIGSAHTDGQSFLMHLARQLKFLAKEYNLAVVVTNGVLSSGREALGRAWSHVPNVRISLSVERSGPSVERSGPSVERSGPSVERSGPSVERSGPSVGWSGPSVGRSGPSVGRSGPSVGRSGPSVERSGPSVERSEPSVERSGPSVERSGPSVERSGPSVERSGPSVGRSGPSVGRSGPSVGRSGPSVERSGPSVERSGSSVGRSGPAVETAGPPVVTSGPPVMMAGLPEEMPEQSMEMAGQSEEHVWTDIEIEDGIVGSDVEMAEMEENIEIEATDDRHVNKFERTENKGTISEAGDGVNSAGDNKHLGGSCAAAGDVFKSLRYAKLTKSTRQAVGVDVKFYIGPQGLLDFH